jgi:DNA invertase Pin-like site-specific DNA recombinase
VSSVGARGARGGGTTSTALIYVRQSRHKEGERTVSPEVQEQQCRALPSVADCDQIDVFSDLDVSGGKLKGRKAFLALIDRVKGGGVTVVAAYDQSRGFRNTSDALDFYALMEKRPEIEVVFVHGRFDRSPAGEFTYTTLAAAHAMERRMTGEKIRDAYRYATQTGRDGWPGARRLLPEPRWLDLSRRGGRAHHPTHLRDVRDRSIHRAGHSAAVQR